MWRKMSLAIGIWQQWSNDVDSQKMFVSMVALFTFEDDNVNSRRLPIGTVDGGCR